MQGRITMPIEPLSTSFAAPAPAPAPAPAARTPEPAAFAAALDEARTPAASTAGDGPPAEALAAVQAAARVYEHMRTSGRQLHFETTETGVTIEVYDGRGELVQRIPPTEALALASGKGATWLA